VGDDEKLWAELFLEPFQYGWRLVSASIVDNDDFIGVDERRHGVGGASNGTFDIALFVESRQNDGDGWGRAHEVGGILANPAPTSPGLRRADGRPKAGAHLANYLEDFDFEVSVLAFFLSVAFLSEEFDDSLSLELSPSDPEPLRA